MALTSIDLGRPVDIRAGDLELRLAESADEVAAAQRLRYQVFYEEMAAQPTAEMAAMRRDVDMFDPHCDHLLVIDHQIGAGAAGVIGTYRLMRRENAARAGRFYSIDEYDISRMLASSDEILELGRSCIATQYRSGPVMQLLWRGITDYVMHYDIALMFGCASLPGTEPAELALPLSYLHHHHLAPEELRIRAVPERYVDMNMLPAEAIDKKPARAALPPLIKGYLRLGGFVGDGAVVDRQFNTTDVAIIVKTGWVTARYYRHYTREDGADRRGRSPA
jgi:putative hemolysin